MLIIMLSSIEALKRRLSLTFFLLRKLEVKDEKPYRVGDVERAHHSRAAQVRLDRALTCTFDQNA